MICMWHEVPVLATLGEAHGSSEWLDMPGVSMGMGLGMPGVSGMGLHVVWRAGRWRSAWRVMMGRFHAAFCRGVVL